MQPKSTNITLTTSACSRYNMWLINFCCSQSRHLRRWQLWSNADNVSRSRCRWLDTAAADCDRSHPRFNHKHIMWMNRKKQVCLCSATYVWWQHGTARAACCSNQWTSPTHSYPSSKPATWCCSGQMEQRYRWTDRQTDGHHTISKTLLHILRGQCQ